MKKLHWLSLIPGILSFSLLVSVSFLFPLVVKTFVKDVFEHFEDNQGTDMPPLSFESPGFNDDFNLRLNVGELQPKNMGWLLYFLCSGGF